MWVLHEGRIPSSNVYRVCVLDYNDADILKDIIKKTVVIIRDNPESLPFIRKYADVNKVQEFLMDIINHKIGGFSILVFYDKELTLSGASLVARGSPWYASDDVQVLNEECTVSFNKGLGLARALVYSLELVASKICKTVRLIQFSNANTPCAKMLENTYKNRLGMSSYGTFYKEINNNGIIW